MRSSFLIIKLLFIIGIFLILTSSECDTQRKNESYFVYVGEYPKEYSGDWAEETQGITHDNNNWYITQSRTLWKIPLTKDLNAVDRNTQGVDFIDLQNVSQLWDKGYDHFGDLTYYPYEKGTFLIIPIEDDKRYEGGAQSALAIFDAKTLNFIDYEEVNLPDASWCAVGPNGHIYMSNSGSKLHEIPVTWFHLLEQNELKLGTPEIKDLLDEQGRKDSIDTPQGGVISPSGKLLYLSAGLTGKLKESWGIHVFDLKTKKRIRRSLNSEGPFNFEFYPGGVVSQEPEGMTIWDLDNKSPSEITGHLHVILLDNEWPQHDDVHLKHYTTVDAYPVLYEDDDYGGLPVPLRNNIPSLSKYNLNDGATSVYVPLGWKVVLYEDDDYRGKSVTMEIPNSNLNNGNLGDEISSVKVYPPN